MNKKRVWLIIIILTIFISFIFTYQGIAADYSVFFNGEKKEDLNIINENGELYMQARLMADLVEADLKWRESIKSLELSDDQTIVKMMVGNPYLQINNTTLKTESGLIIRDGHTYLPCKKVIEAFEYIVKEEIDNKSIYIYKPQSLVKGIRWKEPGKSFVIDTTSLPPYNITETDNPNQLLIEIDRAALSGDFLDGISGENYNLDIKRSPKQVNLEFKIESNSPLSFSRAGVKEDGNNIIVQLLPSLKNVELNKEGELLITADGSISQPEISYLKDPNRVVVDIPSLMLNNFDKEIKDNDWVKNIRVSQFQYDPMVLRIVAELRGEHYFNLVNDNKSNQLVLQSGGITTVSNLSYKKDNKTITFYSNRSLKPNIFELKNPERLVINLPNTHRRSDFKDEIEIGDKLVKRIRTSRFDDKVVRIVADLNDSTNYQWVQKSTDKGYRHSVYLNKMIDSISLSTRENYNDIKINLSGQVDYKVKKFSYPHRLVVDIKDINMDADRIELPETEGIIKNIRLGQYKEEKEDIFRVVFELNDFYGYNIKSESPAGSIDISFPLTEEKENEFGDLIIVDPGHGGFDPGAIGPSGIKEKDINLAIARKVADWLSESGYEVVKTRDRDEFVSLPARVKKAIDRDAGIFVSIHANAANNTYSSGTETFVARENANSDMKLAQAIHDKVTAKIKLDDRGIKKDNFYVIKNTPMPSVLLEVAFLTNPHEESLLDNDLFRDKVGKAIAEGIIRYMKNNNLGADNVNE